MAVPGAEHEISPQRGEGLARCDDLMRDTRSTLEDAPWHFVGAAKLPPPRRGGMVEVGPRVALRPLGSGRRFTRGYNPPPLRGEFVTR